MRSHPASSPRRAPDGFSTLELVVALLIVGMAMVVLAPRMISRPLYFTADLQDLSSNLEVTRGLAQSRTLQYRFRVVSSSLYVVEQGLWSGGVWTFPTMERTAALRPGVAFDVGSVGQTATFDSRGRLVGADTIFAITDSARGWTRQVLVHTTGLVEIQ